MSPISSRNSVPSWASSKPARLARDGAGEGAFLVAEQLAFQQAGGDGGAIELDERALAAALSW